jgi:hypothetical protein
MLWKELAGHCHLLIEKPQPTSEATRPYFISRIETLIRRSHLFVACLPMLPDHKRAKHTRAATGDWLYRCCSPYILFELRLAERANVPRFVLYDEASLFKPPADPPRHVRYVARNFAELKALTRSGVKDRDLLLDLKAWLELVVADVPPRAALTSRQTAFLLPNDQKGRAMRRLVAKAIDRGELEKPHDLAAKFKTDAELYHTLRELRLLVADVSRPELLPLYHAAHSLLVPTIRIHSAKPAGKGTDDRFFPALLRGHPAGYQMDLLSGMPPEKTLEWMSDRAIAITRDTEPIVGEERGSELLHERTYPGKHFIFISHDQKLNDRALVEAIVREAKKRGMTIWEYKDQNRAGSSWRTPLDEALKAMSHMVLLLSPDYEKSPGCMEEWNAALNRLKKPAPFPFFPFLTGGRIQPLVEILDRKIAHEILSGKPEVEAMRVVERLRGSLLNPQP